MDLNAKLSGYYSYSGFRILAEFTGDIRAKTITAYRDIQNRKSTTYSNKPKSKFNPGVITINYKESVLNYKKTMGTSETVQYSELNKMTNINVSYDARGFDIPEPLYLYDVLEDNINISSLPMSVYTVTLQILSGIYIDDIDFPLPITIPMHAYVTSGIGDTFGLNKDIEASGLIKKY